MNKLIYLICLPILLTGSVSAWAAGGWSGYVNDWDEKFTFQCPEGQYIAGVESIHANHSEDRRFDFYCSDHLPTSVNKNKFSGYVNDWDGEFRFQCPEGQYIAGVKSIHANHSEDRKFDFYCASYPPFPPSPTHKSGVWTGYANDWDEPVLFACDPGYYIAGIGSVHANHSEDRRFSFLCLPYYASHSLLDSNKENKEGKSIDKETGYIQGYFIFEALNARKSSESTFIFNGRIISATSNSGKETFSLDKKYEYGPNGGIKTVSFVVEGLMKGEWSITVISSVTGPVTCKAQVPGVIRLSVSKGVSCYSSPAY